jgi:glutamate racemase
VTAAASAPIGVFDSGLGGLTVLRELLARLPNERFLYLGDTARLPYGSKSPETIRRYVEQNVDFLVKRGVKAVVVACNSASSALRPDDRWPVPVYEVIGPGTRAAVAATQSRRVAVFATRATVAGGAYAIRMRAAAPGITVVQEACPLLVPFVEEGMVDDPVTSEMVRRYMGGVLGGPGPEVDTLILGCTHYPLLEPLFRRLLGPGIALVDSGRSLSVEVAAEIAAGRLPAAPQGGPHPRVELLVTDVSDRTDELAARFLAPHRASPARLVDLG